MGPGRRGQFPFVPILQEDPLKQLAQLMRGPKEAITHASLHRKPAPGIGCPVQN